MKKNRYPVIYTLLILVTTFIAGCGGYHFPGDPVERSAIWKGTSLKIDGEGQKKHPILAQILKGKLANRLGISAKNIETSDDGRILHIDLGLPERTLVLEDQSGRADQYQITIQAKPTITGDENNISYPTVRGRTTYYELRASATTQTARNSAQTEALNNLADTLVAVLSSNVK
jgi:outer membrane lipopolysaccharide assembly protein LptE/RlpB